MFFEDHSHIKLTRESDRLTVLMKNEDRAVFKAALIEEYLVIQKNLSKMESPPQWVIIRSGDQTAFSYGGDIEYFSNCIRDQRRDDLSRYGHNCVEVLLRNDSGLGCDAITVGVVEGNALGGGFEVLMSLDYVISVPHARFGLPETQFGLFPGMGAHAFLSRRLGVAKARKIINEGGLYTAQEMFDLGIVTHIAEDGDVDAVLDQLIKIKSDKINGYLGSRKAMARVSPVSREELIDVVDIWTDAAMKLSPQNLQYIEQIVKRQKRQAHKMQDA